MTADVATLRAFIRGALHELKVDRKMIAMLRGTGLHGPQTNIERRAKQVAREWLEGIEMELGHPVTLSQRAQVTRFAGKRWPGLLKRFNNDHRAAQQTLQNLLDAKFSGLRLGE